MNMVLAKNARKNVLLKWKLIFSHQDPVYKNFSKSNNEVSRICFTRDVILKMYY